MKPYLFWSRLFTYLHFRDDYDVIFKALTSCKQISFVFDVRLSFCLNCDDLPLLLSYKMYSRFTGVQTDFTTHLVILFIFEVFLVGRLTELVVKQNLSF